MIDVKLFRIYIVGLVVLAGALLVNILGFKFGVPSWYTFLVNVSKIGVFSGFRELGFWNLYLFVIYPLLLGLFAYLANMLFA